MTSILKPLSTALLGGLLLSGCVLDEDNNDSYNVDVQVGDAVKGVAEVTVTVTGDNTEGQNINVTPHMKMVDNSDGSPGMEHGTPFSVNEGQLDENGEFKTTAYFLMPSAMPASMGGDKMGDWSINVEYNGVTENFPITVDMMMADKKNLAGNLDTDPATTDDTIMHMGATAARPYYVYDLGRDTMGNMDEFSVYVSTRETLFDYSAVIDGAVLNAGTSEELTVGTTIVKMCKYAANTCTWVSANSDGNGVYTASSLGLTGMATDIVRVSLSIDGTTKNTSSDGTGEEYVTFTFPAMSM